MQSSRTGHLPVAIVMATSCFPVVRKGPSHPSVKVLSGVTLGPKGVSRRRRVEKAPRQNNAAMTFPHVIVSAVSAFCKEKKKGGEKKKRKKLSKNFNASHQRVFLLLDGFPKVVSLMLSSSFKHFI